MPVSFISHFCQLPFGKIEGLVHNDQWNLSNHIISFETRNSSNVVHVSIANNLQSGSFTVYSLKTQAHFIDTLKSVTKSVACKQQLPLTRLFITSLEKIFHICILSLFADDENDVPKAAAREAHIFCVPHSSDSSSYAENDFLMSPQLEHVHLPFNGEMYLAKPGSSVKTSKDTTELIEVYSLANRLISRIVSIPASHAASLTETMERLRTSRWRQDLKMIPVKVVAQVRVSISIAISL